MQEHEPKAGDSSHSSTSASLIETEFFLFTQDPRKLPTRQRFDDLILSYFQIPSSAYSRIPYESGWLPAYRLTPARPKGTLVVFGG